jgi:hypothetical protein
MTAPIVIQPNDVREVKQPAGPIGKGKNAVVVGESKTTASTGDSQYKTEFVKVYQDAGVIGVAMLTLLVLCLVMGWFSMRVLKMYTTMLDSRDKAESLRLEFFDKLTTAVTQVSIDVASLKTQLSSDHAGQNRTVEAVAEQVRVLSQDLNRYLFRKLEEPK